MKYNNWISLTILRKLESAMHDVLFLDCSFMLQLVLNHCAQNGNNWVIFKHIRMTIKTPNMKFRKCNELASNTIS